MSGGDYWGDTSLDRGPIQWHRLPAGLATPQSAAFASRSEWVREDAPSPVEDARTFAVEVDGKRRWRLDADIPVTARGAAEASYGKPAPNVVECLAVVHARLRAPSKPGDRRDVPQVSFADNMGNVPSVPGFNMGNVPSVPGFPNAFAAKLNSCTGRGWPEVYNHSEFGLCHDESALRSGRFERRSCGPGSHDGFRLDRREDRTPGPAGGRGQRLQDRRLPARARVHRPDFPGRRRCHRAMEQQRAPGHAEGSGPGAGGPDRRRLAPQPDVPGAAAHRRQAIRVCPAVAGRDSLAAPPPARRGPRQPLSGRSDVDPGRFGCCPGGSPGARRTGAGGAQKRGGRGGPAAAATYRRVDSKAFGGGGYQRFRSQPGAGGSEPHARDRPALCRGRRCGFVERRTA
jgi:hypothetical protein